MNVPSFPFLLLALAAAVLFRISKSHRWREWVLLVTNLGFFATFSPSDPLAYLPFAGFLLLGYAGLHRTGSRVAEWLVVTSIVLAFFWLKKYSFIPASLLISFPYVTVGLSYVFFRVLHLAIDTQQQERSTKPGLVSYLNYSLNFTSLISGPIQRYEEYRSVEIMPAPIGLIGFGRSAERIVVGLFKVFVVSAALSAIQRQLLDGVSSYETFAGRLGSSMVIVSVYPVYLYFNFSGYTDFVIGVSRWFGLILPENFNRPFQSENFITFWNRWHITLSTWLKTYVYQPLLMILMSRFPERRLESPLVVFALFVTFFLVGAWHGQTKAFLFYGVLQGLGISLNKLYQLAMSERLGKQRYRLLCSNRLYRMCARGLTFTWFSFTLLWFWADWEQMGHFYALLGTETVLLAWPTLFILSSCVLSFWTTLFELALSVRWAEKPVLLSHYIRTAWSTALIAILVAVILLVNAPAPPIVYKNF